MLAAKGSQGSIRRQAPGGRVGSLGGELMLEWRALITQGRGRGHDNTSGEAQLKEGIGLRAVIT